jgi:hypothetical protein
MSPGEAAELAALRRQFPQWSIRRVEWGEGFAAQRGGPPSIYGRTLAELAKKIRRAEALRKEQ